MKTIIKLVIVAVVLNATARAGLAAMRHYQFKEAAQQAVLFGAGTPTADVRKLIIARGQELALPVRPENVTVRRQGGRTWADAAYSQSVEFFPRQVYAMNFSFQVESYSTVIGPP